MILKRFIINLFLNIKTHIFRIIDDEQIYLIHTSKYMDCFSELADVLKSTLSKIEDIYYRHILFPKLQAKSREMDQRAC